MSHAMLLRLFLSPFFNISVAMHYLKTYPDSIGISHYLCWRMKHMKAEDVEFYWPQICHLLITRPTQSNALESFVVERAEESTHSAMLTFWFMQAALRDLSSTRATNPRPFMICQRILHKCHEIIFADPPEPSASPYKSLPTSPTVSAVALPSPRGPHYPNGRDRQSRMRATSNFAARLARRVNPHMGPAVVGMGIVLAGTPGMPELAQVTGQVALSQGRAPLDDDEETRRRAEITRGGGAEGPRAGQILHGRQTSMDSEESDVEAQPPTKRRTPSSPTVGTARPAIKLDSPPRRPANLRKGNSAASDMGSPTSPRPRNGSRTSSSGRQHLHPAHTSPSLPSPGLFETSSKHLPSPSTAKSKRTPGLTGPESPLPSAIPRNMRTKGPAAFNSVPALSVARPSGIGPTVPFPSPEALLAAYEPAAQRQLLRAHYCRSEVSFLLTLEDISNRLLVIPKPARVSALRAELTSLNHRLPAEVCMPMWCASDHSHEEGGETSDGLALRSRPDRQAASRSKGHHRVVRISPGDSVVLNSAEKAPYLIHVEILEDDLDFEPLKRANRELLKKIVTQEERKKRKRQGIESEGPTASGLLSFGALMPDMAAREARRTSASINVKDPETLRSPAGRQSSISSPAPGDAPPEEMDLVEQLFGSNFSVRDELPDLTESIPLNLAPKNKQLDAMVWSRADSESPNTSRRPSTMASPGASLGFFETTSTSPRLAEEQAAVAAPSPAHQAVASASTARPVITLDDYSERMRTAAIMLAQLNDSLIPVAPAAADSANGGTLRWIPGSALITGRQPAANPESHQPQAQRSGKLQYSEAAAIKERIMNEMMALEDERVQRMTENAGGTVVPSTGSDAKMAEDEGIIRRELNKADPSAAVFKESWAAKKSRIRAASPWGHLAAWDVLSVIVKTGGDLRQEQLATQLIERFNKIFKEEHSECWVRFFRILITGDTSGLVETITDAISVHSIKKGEYARRLAEGDLKHVSLLDHYVRTYGEMDTGRFARAQRNFIKSLAGYSVVTFLLQIKDRHNGNILVDRDGHLIHIDFGFMLSNSPGGNMGFEAAPFKMPMEYVDIMGGLASPGFAQFKKLFKEGFEAARKHSDSILTIVELMQKDSKLDCFALFGEQTVTHLRERFQLGLTTQAVDAYLERLIVSSIGSNWTRLYDSYQYYSQGVL